MDFPPGFFDREDSSPDAEFYVPPRLVAHIDDGAIARVGALYAELEVRGDVLDLMSSWISHFNLPPAALTVLGMNVQELDANPHATTRVVHDLNVDPVMPFASASFDDAVCCVSIDYLTDPIAVMRDVARVVRPGGRFVVTFSNRMFPTKAIRGWLYASDAQRCEIVVEYFHRAGATVDGTRVTWERPTVLALPPEPGHGRDPLFAVWSRSVHSTT